MVRAMCSTKVMNKRNTDAGIKRNCGNPGKSKV